MTEIINPMKKQLVYAEGKLAFADGMRRGSNPYRWRNKELASIWVEGWDQAKTDNVVKKNRGQFKVIIEMNKRSDITPSMKRMLAYAEGRQAFEEKRWRAFNPYKDDHEKLASDWWNGWDQAKEESLVKDPHVAI